jgi:hypothetical protein
MSTVNANFTDGVLTITAGALSATLTLSEGDFSLEYDAQGGREVTISETRGAVTGVRKGKRRIGKLTCSAKLADPGVAFVQLAEGKTAGYVSVVADLGDANGVDWAFTFSYGAQTRSYYGDDAVFGVISITEGDPSKISFTADLLGPMSSNDTTNGIIVLVPSR